MASGNGMLQHNWFIPQLTWCRICLIMMLYLTAGKRAFFLANVLMQLSAILLFFAFLSTLLLPGSSASHTADSIVPW